MINSSKEPIPTELEVLQAGLDLRDFAYALINEEDFDRKPVGRRLMQIAGVLSRLSANINRR